MDLRKQTMRLLDAIGVSGYEAEASAVAADIIKPFADEVVIDGIYNVAAYKRSKGPGAKTVLLDAHIDQIGCKVSGFTKDGFVLIAPVNCPDDILPGSEVVIQTASGNIRGVCGYLPPVYEPDRDHKAVRPGFDRLFIDTGLTEEEARAKIAVGDSVAFGNGAAELADGSIICRSSDDRICYMSIVHAMELVRDEDLAVNVIAVGSVKEEFDGSGAFARAWADRPDIVVAVDVADRTPLGEGPIITVGGDCDRKLGDEMVALAKREKIPYTFRMVPEVSGTNAKHYQIAVTGAKVCGISHPQKYMHTSVEMISLQDTENIGKLIAAFLRSFGTQTSEPADREGAV